MNTNYDILVKDNDFEACSKDDEFFADFGQVYQGGGEGTKNYNHLYNKPMIEGNVLEGDKTFIQLGLLEITPQDIDDIFDDFIYGG